MVLSLFLGASHFASAEPKALVDAGNGGFLGSWAGTYHNSTGQSGNDSLVLDETVNGALSGTWSGNIPVRGHRINANTAQLRGSTATRSYQITVTVGRNGMNFEYIATRLDSKGSYNRSVQFHR